MSRPLNNGVRRCLAIFLVSSFVARSGSGAGPQTYATLSEEGNCPRTTLWYRAHGRPSKEEKAKRQQYLTPSEERALVGYLLRMSRNGFPVPVKHLHPLAFTIVRQRSSVFLVPSADEDGAMKPPGKNWPQAFYKRHPELNPK